MIRRVEPEELARLPRRDSAFFCRIWSAARMYGGFPFLDLWVQTGEDGQPLALLSRLDGALTLELWKQDGGEELAAFLRMLGGTVLLDGRQAQLLGQPVRTGRLWSRTHTPQRLENAEPPRLKDVYELLETGRGEGFSLPPFAVFYPDLSHRLRHGGAHLAVIEEENRLLACALTVAETPEQAVLGGVAVHPDFRGQGLGRRAVFQLLSQLAQPKLWLLAREEVSGFYAALGFAPAGEWAEFDLI